MELVLPFAKAAFGLRYPAWLCATASIVSLLNSMQIHVGSTAYSAFSSVYAAQLNQCAHIAKYVAILVARTSPPFSKSTQFPTRYQTIARKHYQSTLPSPTTPSNPSSPEL